MSEPATMAIIAVLASAVGALIWVIKYMFDKIFGIERDSGGDQITPNVWVRIIGKRGIHEQS
jgi:hypothetical protein